MEQWKKLLASLSMRQRVMIGVAAVVVVIAVMSLSRWKHDRDFKPLFTGMEAEDAAAVVQKLKETGVEYRLKEEQGSTILVPEAKLIELRLQMASEGLPKSGRAGFELFDRTNLGTTDFAEHINYARAIEGELERSIRLLKDVEQARVHITFPKDSVFVESKQPAKASVLLKLRRSGELSQGNVLAICHLVASAVEGLTPDAVSVLDMHGSLLSRPRNRGGDGMLTEETLAYQEKLERDMLAKINTTLDPLLGAEKFRASVAIECDLTSGEESQESYDPEQTVMLNTSKVEESAGSSAGGGVPGTASNMPRPPGRTSSGGNSVLKRSETISYAPTKTVRHTRIPQGAVKRVSVALLLDQGIRWEKSQRVLIPPTPEALKSIRDVVSAAMSFNAERGDQLVVESLPFESTLAMQAPPLPQGVTAPSSPLTFSLDIKDLRVQIGAAAVGAVLMLAVLGLVLFKRKGKLSKKPAAIAVAKAKGGKAASVEVASEAALPQGPDPKQIVETHTQELTKSLRDQAEQKRLLLKEAQEKLKMEPIYTQKSEILVGYLRDFIKIDPTAAASVIRNWLHEE